MKPLRSVALFIFAFCLLPAAFHYSKLDVARAHEPITTKVRFNKEVVRILQRSCLGCHRAGGVAMSLATYEEARPWAKAIKEEVLEKRMPPWHAVKGYGEFRNAPPLTQREIDLIVNWVEGGAPRGEEKDLPAGPLYSDEWPLGKPDLILKPASRSQVAADADEYRDMVLPTGLKEEGWLSAIDLKPGNGSVLHCAAFYVEGGALLGTWMPGQKTPALPGGAAQLLPAGSRIIMRVHYKGAGEAASDLSAVGLYFTRSVPRKQVQVVAITSNDITIPAGARLHQINASLTVQDDAEAIAIRPRAHPLVTSLQATAYRPDGTQEVLIWTRGYQFDWQPTYYFKEARQLPKGTRIEVIAYFDNSEDNRKNPYSPPRQVRWPELSPEPLCALMIAAPSRGNGSMPER